MTATNWALALAFVVSRASVSSAQTDNVVLVTLDGVRQQELFEGADAMLLDGGEASGIESPDALRGRYWRDTPRERREALMPFFWKELVANGVLLRSRIENPHRNSYPGYAELLTGRVVDEVTGNIAIQNPAETVLEIARRELELPRTGVAAFTSWNHFPYIVESQPGAIFVNAGYQEVPRGMASLEMERLHRDQVRMRSPWDSVRFNAVTLGLATEYLELYRPRVLFIALDETDEWAHARRYDRTLQALESADQGLRELWTRLSELPDYRGKTTLIVTTDHGRGTTLEDWVTHGAEIETARDTWILVVGPDTPARGVVDAEAENRQVAATMLSLLGIDVSLLGDAAGEPIPLAFETPSR